MEKGLILTSEDRIRGMAHGLRDEWLTARLVPWMFVESGGAPWWVCVLTSDGKFMERSHDTVHEPELPMCGFARRVCTALNKHVSNGGAWITAWIDEKRFYYLWKDRDGDIHVVIECDRPFFIIKEWETDLWCAHAQAAWEQWREFYSDVDVGAQNQIRLAQGERPKR